MAKRADRPELRPLFRYWIDRLGLDAWEIEFRYASKADLDGDKRGLATMTRHTRHAYIQILDPRTAKKGDQRFIDVEETVVHELVHLLIDPFYDGESRAERCLEEWAVDAIAKALVAEHRRNRRPKSGRPKDKESRPPARGR